MKMTDVSPEVSALEAAMLHALEDYPVFPCWPANKAPAITPGFLGATTDTKKIVRWFSDGDRLIGMPTAGFIVVDLDRHNPEADGVANWKQLVAEEDPNSLWRATRMVRTATGGIHIWFKDPTFPWAPHRNTAGKIAPGIDTRADGGYVILPPSRTNDGSYEWISRPGAVAMEAPEWLLAILDKKPEKKPSKFSKGEFNGSPSRYAEKALKYELKDLAEAKPGTRNHSLNKAAYSLGQLVGGGLLDESRVIQELGFVAAQLGLDDFEIDRTIESGMSAGKQSPREVK